MSQLVYTIFMTIAHHLLEIDTSPGISIHNLTPQIEALLAASAIQHGHILVFSRHTTTALAINEYEERLLDDLKAHLQQLAPLDKPYRHNDLHLRPGIPSDEPMNAHAHLMALMLSTSEMLPVRDRQLALGTYQSLLFLDLDGPRRRTVYCQIWGE
ncbi:secondary thiamine-phosphate synthase enzyme YjbQ [Trichothermofontia sichuanensis B231]|nr:secondary thiamine-phosphate synthase enzyme YjbQ [Trichothermofontia sichuanensis B231]